MRGLAIRFGAFSKRAFVFRILLCLVPLAAAGAYWIGSTPALLGLAVAVPVLLSARVTVKDEMTGHRTDIRNTEAAVEILDTDFARHGTSVRSACIALEIDGLPEMRTELGITTVDAAIAQAELRILSLMRQNDVLAHLPGNRFAIALVDLRSPDLGAVLSLIERLQKTVGQAMIAEGAQLHLSLSVGFCLNHQSPQKTGSAMLEAAKAALDVALANGPATVRAFDKRTGSPRPKPTQSDMEVCTALKDGQIVPWFQPQISTDTGEITGFEALARWVRPDQPTLLPAEFLPALERAGQMELLSETILGRSLRALRLWDKSGHPIPSVSVNFATQELRNPSLVERIKWDVDRLEIAPHRLTIEILETVISHDDDDVISRNIRALKAQGYRIDLDDFGTGHASIANIRRFAVDRIKIDRSFVTRADEDPDQQRMISAIIGMADNLRIETLAEGIETVGEHSILSQLGCNYLQGYAIARPMPLDQTVHWIAEYKKKLKPAPELKRRSI